MSIGNQEEIDNAPLVERISDILGDDRNDVHGVVAQGDCSISRKMVGHGYVVIVRQEKSSERRNPTVTTFKVDVDGKCIGSTRVMPGHVGGRTGAGHAEDAHFGIDEVVDGFQENPECRVLRLIKQKLGDSKFLKGKAGDVGCEIAKVSVIKFGGYKVTVLKDGGQVEIYRIYGDGSSESSCGDLVPILENMQIIVGEEIDEVPSSLVRVMAGKIAGVFRGKE